MSNHQSKSKLIHIQFNENIKKIQSMFQNTTALTSAGSLEPKDFKRSTDLSGEVLYNELNNKNTISGGPILVKSPNPKGLNIRLDNLSKLSNDNSINCDLSLHDLSGEGQNNRRSTELKLNNIKNNFNSLYLTKNLEKQGSISTRHNQSINKESSDLKHQTSGSASAFGAGPQAGPLLPYLNSLTQFNRRLAKHQHVFYQFNKANNKSYNFIFYKTSKLLNLAFLAMGCLMSRPIYKVIYTNNNLEFEHNTALQDPSSNFSQKILIDLSYFIRKNKNRYLYNNVEVNDNIVHISHPDNINLADIVTPIDMNSQVNLSQRNNILCKYNDKFQFLTDYLNSVLKSEVELDLVRLHKVFYDGHILVQDIALKSYKFRFVKLVSRLFKRLHIQKLDYSNNLNTALSFPSYLSGINIKLAGRTFRQRVIPRMTVKRIQKGSLTNVNVQFIDRARFTGKTRRGAYSFTITLGHVFK